MTIIKQICRTTMNHGRILRYVRQEKNVEIATARYEALIETLHLNTEYKKGAITVKQKGKKIEMTFYKDHMHSTDFRGIEGALALINFIEDEDFE
jgi:hypothetical protein